MVAQWLMCCTTDQKVVSLNTRSAKKCIMDILYLLGYLIETLTLSRISWAHWMLSTIRPTKCAKGNTSSLVFTKHWRKVCTHITTNPASLTIDWLVPGPIVCFHWKTSAACCRTQTCRGGGVCRNTDRGKKTVKWLICHNPWTQNSNNCFDTTRNKPSSLPCAKINDSMSKLFRYFAAMLLAIQLALQR